MKLPTLFIPHGGGPWPFMQERIAPGDPWYALDGHLRGLAATLGRRPDAVLVISGHWEEDIPTVNAAPLPGMLYDYYNFPAHTYRLAYPAPGSPELAGRVQAALSAAGIASQRDEARGYDHGVFIPFMLVWPEADLPIVQLSLRHDLDPAAHLAIGRALAPLREEGVLIVGSGLSYHNLRALRADDPAASVAAERFDRWLTEAVEAPDAALRDARLTAWASAPGARAAQPREEHLLPLMVAAGAAGEDRGKRIFHDQIFGKAYSGFRFG